MRNFKSDAPGELICDGQTLKWFLNSHENDLIPGHREARWMHKDVFM